MSENNMIITVLVPCLNVAPFIEKALRSVTAQSFNDLEILCIDAGSNDGTIEIIDNMSKIDGRIRLLSSPVKSYGYQINMGIREAKGEYISIVESDDEILPEMYNDLYSCAKFNNADYVKSDFYFYKELSEEDVLYLYRNAFSNNSCQYDQLINPMACPELHADCSYIWNGIYKKEFLIEKELWLNESPGAAFQDIGFYHKLICRSIRAVYINKPFYVYRLGREGSSTESGKGLSFAKTEYEMLFNGGLNEYEIEFHGHFIDRKMAISSFCWETDKKLRHNGYDSSSIVLLEDYKWFKELLYSENDRNRFCKRYYTEREWDDITLLRDDPGEYAIKLSVLDNERRKKIDKLNLRGKNINIFGCGRFGMKCYEIMFDQNVFVNCFVDNDSSKWGSRVMFKDVLSPDQSIKLYPDADFIIANRQHHEDIKEQLMTCGISEDRIVVFEPVDSV